MKEFSLGELLAVLDRYTLSGNVVSVTPYGHGHINRTFFVETNEKKYILQAINTEVFRNPVGLMENLKGVTAYLADRTDDARTVMRVLNNREGECYTVDAEGYYWRLLTFVEGSICLERPESEEDFYQAAFAFGKFQRDLVDYPADTLVETIPDFHNTPKRFEAFLAAVDADVCSRVAGVREEIDFYLSNKDFYPVLLNANREGRLPLRVTHNDTKINNVMLDRATRRALCVVDLDTIMPGFSVTDFGDSIRFGACTAAEDEPDASKMHLDLGLFEAYARGFLDGCGGGLPESEVMLMPEGALMMTLECGMRFLTDYLSGDTYFRIAYPEHNLVRARTQIALAREMKEQFADMKAIIEKIYQQT